MVKLGEVNPMVWDQIVEKMEKALKGYGFSAADIELKWRIKASARRIDRELFEKYGILKDYILHPTVQRMKQWIEENVDFSFQLGEPLIPTATAIIVLFMMHKRVSNSALALAGALFFNINPIYAVIASLTWLFFFERKRPKQFTTMKTRRVFSKQTTTNNHDPEVYTESSFLTPDNTSNSTYDHVLIGGDIGTLYSAALLSRVGHRCCVLQPLQGLRLEAHPIGTPCPVPINNLSIGKVERYQVLLDSAQPQKEGGRAIFAPIGSEKTGYASTVIATKLSQKTALSSSSDDLVSGTGKQQSRDSKKGKGASSFALTILRPGEGSVLSDLASAHALDKASLEPIFKGLTESQELVTGYIFSRILSVEAFSSTVKTESAAKSFASIAGLSVYHHLSESLSTLINLSRLFVPLASTAVAGSSEALQGSEMSSAALASAIADAQAGLFYPVGGPAQLQRSLIQTIRNAGGAVLCDVPIAGIEVEEGAGGKKRAAGVRLQGLGLRGPVEEVEGEAEGEIMYAGRSVISCAGALCTFTRLLKDEHVSQTARSAIATLVEAKPKVLVIYWVFGSAVSLGLSSADYIETSAPLPQLERLPSAVKEEFSNAYVKIWSPSTKDLQWAHRYLPRMSESEETSFPVAGFEMQTIVVEFEAPDSIVKLKTHTFTAAPSGHTQGETENAFEFGGTVAPAGAAGAAAGPRLYRPLKELTGRSSQVGGGDAVGETVELTEKQRNQFLERAEDVIRRVYPRVYSSNNGTHGGAPNGSVIQTAVLGPQLGGHRLSNTTARYMSPVTATTDIEGLYLGGGDVGAASGLSGEMQGAWAAANAVLGYTAADFKAGRNLQRDLNAMDH